MSKTLSVGSQKPTVRLSKQAKEFLLFLEANNIDGSVYQEQETKKKLLSIDEIIADRKNMQHHYPVIDWRMKGNYIRKGISIINYIEVTEKAEVRYYGFGSGGHGIEPRSVLISLERTVKNLRLKYLVSRFKHTDRMFHYFITLRGKQILKERRR